jgi:hypothetical protein
MEAYQEQMGVMEDMDEMEDQLANEMDPKCRKDLPDRPIYKTEDYTQKVTDSNNHLLYADSK